MDLVRTAVSAPAFFDVDIRDNSYDANVRRTIRLMAKVPTAIVHGLALSALGL